MAAMFPHVEGSTKPRSRWGIDGEAGACSIGGGAV
jgi:hypothetical protein